MIDDAFGDIKKSNITPLEEMYFKEFVIGLYKAGSAISMLEGKKINFFDGIKALIAIIKYRFYN